MGFITLRESADTIVECQTTELSHSEIRVRISTYVIGFHALPDQNLLTAIAT